MDVFFSETVEQTTGNQDPVNNRPSLNVGPIIYVVFGIKDIDRVTVSNLYHLSPMYNTM